VSIPEVPVLTGVSHSVLTLFCDTLYVMPDRNAAKGNAEVGASAAAAIETT
jgi:hypothetical protein